MGCIARLYFRGGLVANEVGVLEGTTSANELAYGLHSAKVATRELACVVDWEASQGRCSKVQKNTHIRKRTSEFLRKVDISIQKL